MLTKERAIKRIQGNIIRLSLMVNWLISPEKPGAIIATKRGAIHIPRVQSSKRPSRLELIMLLDMREAVSLPDLAIISVKTGIKAVARAPPIITYIRLGRVKAII
jgi:hypothetical protein